MAHQLFHRPFPWNRSPRDLFFRQSGGQALNLASLLAEPLYQPPVSLVFILMMRMLRHVTIIENVAPL